MSDNQFYILITVIGAGLGIVGGAIRFTANRLVGALDANTKSMLENTRSNAILSTKIDSVADYVARKTGEHLPQQRKTQPNLRAVQVKASDESEET